MSHRRLTARPAARSDAFQLTTHDPAVWHYAAITEKSEISAEVRGLPRLRGILDYRHRWLRRRVLAPLQVHSFACTGPVDGLDSFRIVI